MSVNASGIILGFLLATAYGAAFHVIMGGPARRIILYVFASWFGFTLGHIVGEMIGMEFLKLGALQLFTASIGAWISLVGCWWLVGQQHTSST